MKNKNLALGLTGGLLALVACFHLFRLAIKFGLDVAGHPVPLWLNGVGVIVAGGLSIWLFSLRD